MQWLLTTQALVLQLCIASLLGGAHGALEEASALPQYLQPVLRQHDLPPVPDKDADCAGVAMVIGEAISITRNEYSVIRAVVLQRTQQIEVRAAEIRGGISQMVRDPVFRSLLPPIYAVRRLVLDVMEFLGTTSILHGPDCYWQSMLEDLGEAALQLKRLNELVTYMDFDLLFRGRYHDKQLSSNLALHVTPVWEIMAAAATFVNALVDVQDNVGAMNVGLAQRGYPTVVGGGEIHDLNNDDGQYSTGAFSKLNFMRRQLHGHWHLDYGLVASLIRLWQPKPHRLGKAGECHTTIVDFGAGSGHYCAFLNKTGDYCCTAYDGSPHAKDLTGGRVGTLRLDAPFSLGKSFDWVMCLEVAEHVPREFEAVMINNLRRHAREGLVLSWSEQGGSLHPNARSTSEVRDILESAGFVFDAHASRSLTPQIDWIRGSVGVYRVA